MVSVAELFQDFTWLGLWQLLQPLLLFIIGIVIYAVFIFKFYRFVAKKDIFDFELGGYAQRETFFATLEKIIAYILKYIFIFPFFLFFWFVVLTVFLIFLAKEQSVTQIMLISVALIGAVRVTAYYNEDLSKDLAKMLPFALLGIFLVDISYFSQASSLDMMKELPGLWKNLLYYLAVIMCIELVLRVFSPMFRLKKEEQL